MDKTKKAQRITFRLDDAFEALAERLRENHNEPAKTQHMRGLILIDAKLSGLSTNGYPRPGWLSRVYPGLFGDSAIDTNAVALVVRSPAENQSKRLTSALRHKRKRN